MQGDELDLKARGESPGADLEEPKHGEWATKKVSVSVSGRACLRMDAG